MSKKRYLSDEQAMSLIQRELSGVEWSPDTLDVIAAYVRGTGREIADADDAWKDPFEYENTPRKKGRKNS